MNHWEHVADADSESEPGKSYEIKRHTRTGAFACGCMAYRFSKGVKTCKHLQGYHMDRVDVRGIVVATPPPVHARVTVQTAKGAEVVHIHRRAISFGAVT